MKKSLHYLAGLFDGEGSFSIQVGLRQYKSRPPSIYFNPSMSVNLYYGTDVLEAFREEFGGQIYPYSRNGESRGARWHLGRHEEVMKAAGTLQPYLEIKNEICRRFIEALTLFPSPGGANRKKGDRVWLPDVAVKVAEIALTLNPARSRKCNKTLEYLTEFKNSLSN